MIPDWVGSLASESGKRVAEAEACIAAKDAAGAVRLLEEARSMLGAVSSAWAGERDDEEEERR